MKTNLKRTRRRLTAFLDSLNDDILAAIVTGDTATVRDLSFIREKTEVSLFRLDDLIARKGN